MPKYLWGPVVSAIVFTNPGVLGRSVVIETTQLVLRQFKNFLINIIN